MIPLFTQDELNNAKVSDMLPCKCYVCNITFYKQKRSINKVLQGISGHTGKFCSKFCESILKSKKQKVICLNCNTQFEKSQAEIKKTPNHFCSKSCAAIFNNKHKKNGNRRSKLEIYLEEKLNFQYPNLHIDYNRKNAIGSELDIYIPILKLAFELNGIFHYEPIYGSNKLNQIQKNDLSKSKACLENHIDLCIIDSSGLKYFKPSNAQKYLDIIVNIINQRTSLLIS